MNNRLSLTAIFLTMASGCSGGGGGGAAAPASLDDARLILLSKSSAGYNLSAYNSNASFSSPTTAAQNTSVPLSDDLRAFGSDGEQFFSITRENNLNCFSRYSSVQYLSASTPYSKACNSANGDGYRAIIKYRVDNGISRYVTIFYANGTTYWGTYNKWDDVVSGEASSMFATSKIDDIYKGIAYNESTKTFVSFSQIGTTVYHFIYDDYDSLKNNTGQKNSSYEFQYDGVLSGVAFAPTSPVMEIVLAAGQSNAVGWSTNVDPGTGLALDRDGNKNYTRNQNIKFVYDIGLAAPNDLNQPAFDEKKRTRSRSLTEPSAALDTLTEQQTGWTTPSLYIFGIEQAAQRMSQPVKGLPFGVLKVAFGGSNLYRQWTSPLMSTPTSPDAINPSLLDVLKLDLAVMKSKANQRVRVVGLLWMQGESDASVTNTTTNTSYSYSIPNVTSSYAADNYKKNFENLYHEMEVISGAECLPAVAGLIRRNPSWPHVDTVREAILSSSRARPACIATVDANLSDITVVEPISKHPQRQSDPIHLDNKGAWTFGVRIGDAYELLTGRNR